MKRKRRWPWKKVKLSSQRTFQAVIRGHFKPVICGHLPPFLTDGACLPACVRMVLAYWGQSFTEAEIAKVLGTKAYGTPISNVERFSRQGYQVEFGSFTVDHLKDSLTAARPGSSRVWTDMLDYWPHEATSHVVVVVGFDDRWVYLNDPSLIEQAPPVTWASYLAAWAEFDETAVLIYPVR